MEDLFEELGTEDGAVGNHEDLVDGDELVSHVFVPEIDRSLNNFDL